MAVKQCTAKRLVPLLPEDVQRRLETELTFTGRGDIPIVGELYCAFFENAGARATRLDFAELAWGREDARKLTEVFPRLASCAELSLRRNNLGSASAVAQLVSLLRHNKSLTKLDLRDCGFDSAGLDSIATALHENDELRLQSLQLGTFIACVAAEPSFYVADVFAARLMCTIMHGTWPRFPFQTLKFHGGVLIEMAELTGASHVDLSPPKGFMPAACGIVVAKFIKLNALLTKLNFDGFELNLPQLRGTDPVEVLDLSDQGLLWPQASSLRRSSQAMRC